ncbi:MULTISPECIES: hydroxymethylbilane synthase [unclassified Microbacterium]|uniref:hydroxymethylbilane synthase n=1 Tax=unclassified Microbacterium TaxID=2609290 RepID=UPI00214C442A|nr:MULTISPECIES: hydroxymethylbilane synthase [unclassified Microbacterium]MCR2783329.1 hydroxymethylbilane synthase [Microbacterium sp. zg.B96]WIM15798.1 hydroxymethylbilane synthase [Microbacterium sp. zg-B96]
MTRPFRLGTRRSALATAQSQQVADMLAAASGRPVELVPIVSEGDVSRASLSQMGGTGVFATRLREALLAGECDLLVHSLKDLPTAQPPGLVIAAIPAREDARDVVVTRDGTPLHQLPPGARVGTGSPRRRAQVHRRNPRVDVQDLRGNVDSRLQRVRDGQLDAVVLAAAGLARIGLDLTDLGLEALGLAAWPTAPGQGALAIETTADAPEELRAALALIDHTDTRIAVTAERAVLATLEAGCHAPVGAHAELTGGDLRIDAVVYALDGSSRIGLDRSVPVPQEYGGSEGSGDGADAADDASPIAYAVRAGSEVARRLLERGAAELVPRESTP